MSKPNYKRYNMETKMIGSKIAEARKKLTMSQAQLAEHLFVSAQAVGKWERGESIPDLITFNRLAKVLGVDLNYFSQDFHIEPGRDEPELPGVEPVLTAELNNGLLAAANQKKKINWDMSRGNWVDADFSGLKNLHEKFSGSNLQRCLFIDSDLSGLLLKGNHIENCDFRGSDISGSHFHSSHVQKNLFNDCLLKEGTFTGSHIQACDFSGADLSGIVLKSSSFRKNLLKGAIFNQSRFIMSDIADIVFEGIIEDCSFENCSFTRVTFQSSTLINTFFKGGGFKKIRFIDCRADRLTYEFLKSGKADVSTIVVTE